MCETKFDWPYKGTLIKFNDEASNKIREIEKENNNISVAFFIYLQFSGIITDLLYSDNADEFLDNLAKAGIQEALVDELTNGSGNIILGIWNGIKAVELSKKITETEGPLSIFLMKYIENEPYYNGGVWVLESSSTPSLLDGFYIESIDEAKLNKCGCTLKKKDFFGDDRPNCFSALDGYMSCPLECTFGNIFWKCPE